jgi:uncharacterized protein (TIGR03083 family)
VEISQFIDHLVEQGHALAGSAEKAGLDADVPSCTDWQVRDMLQHTGQVHRWAMSYVTTGRTTPPGEGDSLAAPPGDDELIEWFRDGHAHLVEALRSAPDDLDCWAFLPAPSPRAFWARRQAHETAIHRADADAAAGAPTSYDATFAADGVEELLFGFYARPRGRLVSDPPIALALRADDTGDAWTMTIGPESRSTVREASADAHCTVTATAADLYLLLWNRRDVAGLDIHGDPAVLNLWREKAKIAFR